MRQSSSTRASRARGKADELASDVRQLAALAYSGAMRLGPVAENPIEWLVGRLNIAPRPLLETQMAFTLARVVMVGTKLGVFDALAKGPATAAEVAGRCETNPTGTDKLLFALAGAGYLRAKDGRYELTAVSRKWLLRNSPNSLADKMLFQFLEWDWMESSEDYVRTGEPLDAHESMKDPRQWDLYQRGMRALANALSTEALKRMPVPPNPRNMLDIGGSHGYYSVGMARKHPGLRGVILDLPEAVEQAAPLLAAEGMGERVVHRGGNALTDDLGTDAYDIVLIAQVVHHFSEEQNRELAQRVARALRPGGVYAVLDAFRPRDPGAAGQVGALFEFYFALTSQSGTWTVEEIAGWQRKAGLSPRRPIRFRTAPGAGIQAAFKPN
jgi:predicted O-methyltransferase YrrM